MVARGAHEHEHQSGGEGQRHQGEVGPDEGAEAGEQADHHGAPAAAEASDEEPPQRSDPEEDQTGLEARGGEVPHDVDADEAEHPRRDDDRGTLSSAQPSTAGDRERHAAGGAGETDQDGPPGGGEHAEGPADQGQDPHPDRVGEDLDPLADVEDGAVAREQVPNHAHVDVGVVSRPSVRPAADEDDHDRQGHEAPTDPGAHRGPGVAVVGLAHRANLPATSATGRPRATAATCCPGRAVAWPSPTSACGPARAWSRAGR